MNFKKIENISDIKPIEGMKIDGFDYTYKNLFKQPFFILYIMGMRASGKGTLIWNLLEKIVGNKTNVFLFGCSANTDETLIKIQKKMKKYKINFELYENLEYEGKPEDYYPYDDILDKIYRISKNEIERDIENGIKGKKQYCKNILIFDDFAQYLRKGKTIEI